MTPDPSLPHQDTSGRLESCGLACGGMGAERGAVGKGGLPPGAAPPREFCWLSGGEIPSGRDLRGWGWRICPTREVCENKVALVQAPKGRIADWPDFVRRFPRDQRSRIAVLDVASSSLRAWLLRLGFADALATDLEPVELEARVAGIAARLDTLHRHRRIGPLVLDLLSRDAIVEGQRLILHPREFGLMWRLAEEPGTAVAARVLLSDVWNLDFVPQTNSLAVHVSRLRAKLARFGLAAMLESAQGGYRLRPEAAPDTATLAASPAPATRTRHADGTEPPAMAHGIPLHPPGTRPG